MVSRLQSPDARDISQPSYAANYAASPVRLMPVAGLQDVGHAAVATGRGELRLRSFVHGSLRFSYHNK